MTVNLKVGKNFSTTFIKTQLLLLVLFVLPLQSFAATIVVQGPTSAGATGVYSTGWTGSAQGSVGQSFISAGTSISGVGAQITVRDASSNRLTFNLVSGSISGTVLASKTITHTNTSAGWVDVFFDSPVTVTNGNTYYIRVDDTDGDDSFGTVWTAFSAAYNQTDGGLAYAGGNAYYANTISNTGADLSFRVYEGAAPDTTAPRITSIVRQSPVTSPTNSDTPTWRVTFDEAVQNVDASDFTVSGTTGTLGLTQQSTSVYDLAVSGGDIANLNATITLGFSGGQNISDTSSNALSNLTPTGTNNNTFAILNDTSAPSVDILNAPSNLVTRASFTVTFEFSEDVTGFDAVDDITVGNGVTSNFLVIDGNTYTADITPSGAGNLTIDVAAGVAQDAASNLNTKATQVLVACGPGCGEVATIARTKKVLQNYTGNRIRHITAQGPAISGFLDDDGMSGSVIGLFESPLMLNYHGESDNNTGSFSTSLQQLTKFKNNLNVGEEDLDSMPTLPSPANFWIKGRWSKINDDRGDLESETDFGIVYIGTDYRLSDDLLIGFMGQYDWFDESESVLNSKAEGKGWMVGPYMVKRLKDTLTMDLRLAWGQSDNKVNPIGTYWDSFDGERWQVEGNLTGSFRSGFWHIAPAVGLNYFNDIQKSYTDSNGFEISRNSTELGTVSFGPKLTYMPDFYDGSQWQPFVILKGVWDFKSPTISDVNGLTSGTEKLRALAGFGLSVDTTSGSSLQASYTYDGIGISDYESHSAELSAHISMGDHGLPSGSSLIASYSIQNILLLEQNDSQSAKLELRIPFE